MMTNWLPNLDGLSGPLYARLAISIEHAIDDGTLAPGAKLPPQRNLAFDIGVTIGTVSRAYAIVRERGLVSGEVGRGTYVRSADDGAVIQAAMPGMTGHKPGRIDAGHHPRGAAEGLLRLDSTAAPFHGESLIADAFRSVMIAHPQNILDYVRGHPAHWAEAGQAWLARGNWRPQAADVVQVNGGHAGILAIVNAMTVPGDAILFESLTYSSIARAIALIGRRVVTVKLGPDGIDPEELESVCAQRHPRLAFLMPDLNNPTLGRTSLEKRLAIIDVARRNNMHIVEDVIYAAIGEPPLPPLASLDPDHVFHVGGFSKAVAAGLRAGWVACPPHLSRRVQTAHRMMTAGVPFLMAETAAQLSLSGTAQNIRVANRAEVKRRVAMARTAFAGLNFEARDDAPFLWLRLPDEWMPGTFKSAAAAEGILIDDEDEFKPARDSVTDFRVRIGLTAVRDVQVLQGALAVLRRMLDAGAPAYGRFE
jgi:DNA-binding transcriptional MocR family regulator